MPIKSLTYPVDAGEKIYCFCFCSGRSEQEAREKAAKKFDVAEEKIKLKQGMV